MTVEMTKPRKLGMKDEKNSLQTKPERVFFKRIYDSMP